MSKITKVIPGEPDNHGCKVHERFSFTCAACNGIVVPTVQEYEPQLPAIKLRDILNYYADTAYGAKLGDPFDMPSVTQDTIVKVAKIYESLIGEDEEYPTGPFTKVEDKIDLEDAVTIRNELRARQRVQVSDLLTHGLDAKSGSSKAQSEGEE